MLQSCHGWADKMIFFFKSEVKQTYAKARCFSSATSAALSTAKATPSFQKMSCFSVFAAEKNFLKPSSGTHFLPLCGIWAAPQVEPGQRIPRMFPCVQLVGDDLPLQQTSQPVVVVGLAPGTSWLWSTAQTRELQLNLSKQKQLQLWGNQGKEERQVLSTENHWTDGWSERYWNLV